MRPQLGPVAPIARAQRLLTLEQVRAELARVKPHQRVRVLAKHDPLRNVPQGDFTLDRFSYAGADLCHNEFANCELRNLGRVA